jgi:hypothetical protein
MSMGASGAAFKCDVTIATIVVALPADTHHSTSSYVEEPSSSDSYYSMEPCQPSVLDK